MNEVPQQKAKQRVLWFLAVGASAAAVHWVSVVIAVKAFGWPPLLANVAGWLIAFAASFSGHYLLTFRDHAAPLFRSLRRFFSISAFGFCINEALYALALHYQMRYDWALLAVLVAVAVLTYFLAQRWAFLRA